MPRQPSEFVTDHLTAAKLMPFLTRMTCVAHAVTAQADPHLLITLRARREEFKEGCLYGLHRDVGDHLVDFRGFRNLFGHGSLQIVIDVQTWRCYADVDVWSPYEDVIGFVGHSAEVVSHWLRRWRA